MSLRTSHWLYLLIFFLAYLLVRIIARYYFHYRGEVAIVLSVIILLLIFLVIYLVRRWRAPPSLFPVVRVKVAGCRLVSLRTSPKLIPEEWQPPGFGIV
jgi:hypothetical protein